MGARIRRKIAAAQTLKYERITRAGAAKVAQRVLDLEPVIEALINVVGRDAVFAELKRLAEAQKEPPAAEAP